MDREQLLRMKQDALNRGQLAEIQRLNKIARFKGFH